MRNEMDLDCRNECMRKLPEHDIRNLQEDELDFVSGGQGVIITSPHMALYPH